ncbi:MAG: prepilin-type N-terminal cleavage/methylation domain-containing protein [Patescibacteria group bacterium]
MPPEIKPNNQFRGDRGFTIMEILVAVFLFSFLMIMTGESYLLAQRSFKKGAEEGELAQNARVALDRISREIRQSGSIISSLPPSADDPENPPISEFIIGDGHNPETITYIRYYLSGNDLMRQHYGYYLSDNPETFVTPETTDEFGNPPLIEYFSDDVIGEYFESLGFYGSGGLVNINLSLLKNARAMNITISVYSRNK